MAKLPFTFVRCGHCLSCQYPLVQPDPAVPLDVGWALRLTQKLGTFARIGLISLFLQHLVQRLFDCLFNYYSSEQAEFLTAAV